MAVTYVQCRTLGHAWDDVSALPEFRTGIRYLMGTRKAFRCTRCQTIRREVWSPTGQMTMRSYEHPDDYKLGEKWSRSSFRVEYLKKVRRARKKAG